MTRRKNKGQVSIEFMLLIGFVAVVFTVMMGMFGTRLYEIQENYKDDRVTNMLRILKEEIEIAGTCEDGYKKDFKINKNLIGENYSFSIEANSVLTIKTEDSNPLITLLPNDTLIKSIGYINSSSDYLSWFAVANDNEAFIELRIEKINGTVSITNCMDCNYSYYFCINLDCAEQLAVDSDLESECINYYGNFHGC